MKQYSKYDNDWIKSIEMNDGDPNKIFGLNWYEKHFLTKELLKQDFSGNVLDLGCGIGTRTYLLAKKFKQTKVVGIDISAYAIDFAKKQWKDQKNLTFYNHSVYDILFYLDQYFDCEKVDCVFALQSFEHLVNLKGMLKLIHLIMKLNGMLFISVPDGNAYGDSSHVNYFNKNIFLNLMNKMNSNNYQRFTGKIYMKDKTLYYHGRKV
jgi:ubiquinone/menaquinone biosynthesis C-methylase UbiE